LFLLTTIPQTIQISVSAMTLPFGLSYSAESPQVGTTAGRFFRLLKALTVHQWLDFPQFSGAPPPTQFAPPTGDIAGRQSRC
jgi:hypothetical protein